MDFLNFDKANDYIGVDFDGTLHDRSTPVDENGLGQPVMKMVNQVKEWLSEGYAVKIFTARVAERQKNIPTGWTIQEFQAHQVKILENWCLQNIGCILPITCQKDAFMYRLYDDRAVAVQRNTGVILGENIAW